MTKTRDKFVPDRALRISAIHDIVYEYGNWISAGYYSIHGCAPWRTNCDDAFLLGCRKLYDFLMQEKRSTRGGQELDDVLALDYLPANPARNWELPVWIGEWREPMNKQLAHIAYCRDKDWDHQIWVPKLKIEFREAWGKFRKAIVDEEFSREFDRQLSLCQAKPGFENLTL